MPRGLRHAFRVTSSEPVRFLALVAPGTLMSLYDEVGRPAGQYQLPPPDQELLMADVHRWLKAAPQYGLRIVGPPLPEGALCPLAADGAGGCTEDAVPVRRVGGGWRVLRGAESYAEDVLPALGAQGSPILAGRGVGMSRYRSARLVLAGAAAVALAGVTLAGCGTPSSTSPETSNSSPAGSTSRSGGALNGGANAVPTVTAGSGPVAGSGPTAGASVAPSNSIPFPAAVGNTWVYDVTNNVNNTHATETKKVLSVNRITGGTRVTMSDTLSPGPGTTIENYVFYDNGQIGFPVNVSHGVSVVSDNGVVWPDVVGLDSGRAYHSVLKIRFSNGKYDTANVTVQGDGTVPVSVPAGNHQTTLVTMIISSKVGRFPTTAVVKVWIASGTGPVKSGETLQAGGNTQLVSTSELVSFSKGGGRADNS